jgi:hypothetical protein
VLCCYRYWSRGPMGVFTYSHSLRRTIGVHGSSRSSVSPSLENTCASAMWGGLLPAAARSFTPSQPILYLYIDRPIDTHPSAKRQCSLICQCCLVRSVLAPNNPLVISEHARLEITGSAFQSDPGGGTRFIFRAGFKVTRIKASFMVCVTTRVFVFAPTRPDPTTALCLKN